MLLIALLFLFLFSQKWTVGTPCRAVYSVDGKIYEAIVKRIFKTAGGGTCIVEFIGNYFGLFYYHILISLPQ